MPTTPLLLIQHPTFRNVVYYLSKWGGCKLTGIYWKSFSDDTFNFSVMGTNYERHSLEMLRIYFLRYAWLARGRCFFFRFREKTHNFVQEYHSIMFLCSLTSATNICSAWLAPISGGMMVVQIFSSRKHIHTISWNYLFIFGGRIESVLATGWRLPP